MTCQASSECPPCSKKLSSIPTCDRCSTSCQIMLNSSCRGARIPVGVVGGAVWCGGLGRPPSHLCNLRSGTGKARRSTFPFGVRQRRQQHKLSWNHVLGQACLQV